MRAKAFDWREFLLLGSALVLNGLAGVAFGFLCWRQGLESAVLAHFTADVVLHALAPLLAAGR